MREEWLEEVDVADRVLTRRLRSEIHRCGLRHRSVHILLFNRRGALFLQKRSMSKDVHPGLWDSSAAGHVDPGESYDAAAQRELQEELGLHPVPPLEFLFKVTADAATGWEFIHVYRTIHEGPFRLNTEEIDEGRWLHPEGLDRWIATGAEDLTATFRDLWRRFRAGRAGSR